MAAGEHADRAGLRARRHARADRCRARAPRRRHSPPRRGRAPAGRRRRARRRRRCASRRWRRRAAAAPLRGRAAPGSAAPSRSWRSAGGYSGSPSATKRTPSFRASVSSRSTSSTPATRIGRRPAAPRQFRQRVERARARRRNAIDERAKRARADILRADQPQPVETLASLSRASTTACGHLRPSRRCAVSVPREQPRDVGAVPDPHQRRQRAKHRRDVVSPSASAASGAATLAASAAAEE